MQTVSTQAVLRVHPEDDLIVALADLPAGGCLDFQGRRYVLPQRVPAKHKFAARDLPAGQRVKMYGVTVGTVLRDIAAGQWVNTENLTHAADPATVGPRRRDWQPPDVSRWAQRRFMGYHRSDGRVGTANYWLFIPLVFCENRNIQTIRQAMLDELGYGGGNDYRLQTRRLVEGYRAGAAATVQAPEMAQPPATGRVFPNIDGIKFLTHTLGCGGTREDADRLCALLAEYICHPNVAGATVLSLGCQNAQVDLLVNYVQQRSPAIAERLRILDQQRLGTEPTLIGEAIRQTFTGLIEANAAQREPAPLDKLTIGVKCGGSDGFSGITANPAMGYCADLLVSLGGSVLLAEFPELAGVEQELVDRCVHEESARRFLGMMKAYNDRAVAVGSGFDRNPSPGNIADGLITDAMKSAGAVRKGGTSPVTDVLDYAEPVTRAGLNLLCSPGNDVESTTAMAGSGAQIILFSTGLGTPTGSAVAQTLKISTNTALTRRMPDIIDLDAGPILRGEQSIEQVGETILELVIETACGLYTPHAVRLGQDDFIPWKRGVSL